MHTSSRLSKRKITAICIAAPILAALIAPEIALAYTIEPRKVNGPIHWGKIGEVNQFYVNYEFRNPGLTSVTITRLESKVLMNGTDYNSQQMLHTLGTIQPLSTGDIPRVIKTGPILMKSGYQHWNVTIITEITAISKILFIEHTRTFTDVTSFEWFFEYVTE